MSERKTSMQLKKELIPYVSSRSDSSYNTWYLLSSIIRRSLFGTCLLISISKWKANLFHFSYHDLPDILQTKSETSASCICNVCLYILHRGKWLLCIIKATWILMMYISRREKLWYTQMPTSRLGRFTLEIREIFQNVCIWIGKTMFSFGGIFKYGCWGWESLSIFKVFPAESWRLGISGVIDRHVDTYLRLLKPLKYTMKTTFASLSELSLWFNIVHKFYTDWLL